MEVSTGVCHRLQTVEGKVLGSPWGLDSVRSGKRKWLKEPSAATCPGQSVWGPLPAWGCSCTARSPGGYGHSGSELVRFAAGQHACLLLSSVFEEV